MNQQLRNYSVVTGGYWAFTITDGAIRMLVVLYFHMLGYSPLEVAMLFLFYELCGVFTNLVGGWLAARLGLNVIMHTGMALQVIALLMLTVPDAWLSVVYVMFAQALSGIAKDLNKMSAKASVKLLVPQGAEAKLFKWVSVLTGSKNALKGVGFFIGAVLLDGVGFRDSLVILATVLTLVLLITWMKLPRGIGKMTTKPAFTQLFSNNPSINWLSAARLFLFGSRDVWFVVALPLFLYSVVGWSFTQVGTFFACWVIGYGFVQAIAPNVLSLKSKTHHVDRTTLIALAITLSLTPIVIAIGLDLSVNPSILLMAGLSIFGFLFALNSAVHSYLILSYADSDRVSLDVGFYYMANASGRLIGTVLSGLIYQKWGMTGCLYCSAVFILLAALLSCKLPASADCDSGRP